MLKTCDGCQAAVGYWANVREGKEVKRYCVECYMPTLKGRYPIYAAWKSHIKKNCKKCHTLIPATEEFFKRNKNGEYGLSDICIECSEKIKRIQAKTRNPTRRIQMAKTKRLYKMRDWFDTVDAFFEQCAYCGQKTIDLQMDHIISISKGGEHIKQNIVPACKKCNSAKSNHDMEEWYKAQTFFNDDRYNKILAWTSKKKFSLDI